MFKKIIISMALLASVSMASPNSVSKKVVVVFDKPGLAKVVFSLTDAPNYKKTIANIYIVEFKDVEKAKKYTELLNDSYFEMIKSAELEKKLKVMMVR